MATLILPASQFCDYGHIVEALVSELQQVLLVDVQTHSEIATRLKALELEKEVPRKFSLYFNGQYLYLTHYQTPEKKRWREYVGNKPERVRKAVEEYERRLRLERLSREKRDIERRAFRVARALARINNITKEQI